MTISNWLELAHVRVLLDDTEVYQQSADISLMFWEHLSRNYPIVPTTKDSVNWKEVPDAISLQWAQASDSSVEAFIRKTRLGHHTYVGIVYSQNAPCLFCPLVWAISRMERLFLTAHHAVYLFGLQKNINDDSWKFEFNDFVELDLDDEIILSGIAILN